MVDLIYDMPISEQIADIVAAQCADDRTDIRPLTRAERRRRHRVEVAFAADQEVEDLAIDWHRAIRWAR